MTTWRRLHQVLFSPGSELAELMVATMTWTYGFWLLNPFYKSLEESAVSVLLRIMSETGWGLIALLLGGMKLVALLYGAPEHRRWGMLIVAVFWLFLSLLLSLGAPSAPGLPFYWCITAFSGWLYLRRISDERLNS